jgi:outer membrane protein assembly factor BamB
LVLDDTVIAGSFQGGLVAFSRSSGARQWEVPLIGASSPIYAAGAVVTTTAAGSVVWIDANTGIVRYELQLNATTAQAPVHIGELLYISTPRGVFLVDAAVPWVYHRFDPGEPVTTLPATDGHRLFVLSDTGVVYALELREF